MEWKVMVLRLILAVTFVVNIFLGVAALSSESLVLKVAEMIYGVKLAGLEQHTLYIIKMMGCFIIALAVMAGLAVKDPLHNKAIVYGTGLWLVLRGLQRAMYVGQFHQDWGISYGVLWGQVVFVLFVGITLFVLVPLSEKK